MKKIVFVLLLMSLLFTACASPADVASQNLSREADQFKVNRRIVFINGITDNYMLTVEGLCSLGNFDTPDSLSVTCKVGENQYKKHFLGLSDNVTYISEQLDPMPVGVYRYEVIFAPLSIIPTVDLILPE